MFATLLSIFINQQQSVENFRAD